MEHPKVSYIIASYNHAKYIGYLIESILNQTIDDFEVVIVDDGSIDRSIEIISDFARQDERIQFISQENEGVVAARNKGILISSGEFISIVDSDDVLPRDRTFHQITALENNPLSSFVYGDAWLIDEEGARIGKFSDYYPPVEGNLDEELFANYCFIPAVSVLFRRSLLEQVGLLWGPGPSCDYLKWVEFAVAASGVHIEDPPLGCWRIHGKNTFALDLDHRIDNYMQLKIALRDLLIKYPALNERLGDRVYKRFAKCHFMSGFYAGLDGSWTRANSQYREAISIDKSFLNFSALLSTMPVIRMISSYIYRAYSRKIL